MPACLFQAQTSWQDSYSLVGHATMYTISVCFELHQGAQTAQCLCVCLGAGSSRAAPVSASRAALERALVSERGTGSAPVVTHLCVSPTPLSVPLPFPRFFVPHISRDGAISTRASFPPASVPNSDALQWAAPRAPGQAGLDFKEGSGQGGRRPLGPDVVSAPVLGRLISPRGGSPLVLEALEVLRGARRRTPGVLSLLSSVSKAAGLEESELETCIEALESVGDESMLSHGDD